MTPHYKNAKKFTFIDTQMHTKLTYFCQNREDLYPMAIRAPRAHQYFVAHNNQNAELLLNDIKHHKAEHLAMKDFNTRAKVLALTLHRKFACTLIQSRDY